MNKDFMDRLVEIAQSVPALISAFVTNLGKYTEGELTGEWLALPTTTEKVQECLKRTELDGIRYEEYFITDYETAVDGLYDRLPEYANLDELNYLAAKLEELDSGELEKYGAVLEHDGGYYGGSVKDLINLTENLDCFDYYPDIHSNEDWGYYLIDELDALEIPDHVKPYFDYEAYGRDMAINEGGTFTGNGYIIATGDRFMDEYDGKEVPEEYRVFAYPQKDIPKYKKSGHEKSQPFRNTR